MKKPWIDGSKELLIHAAKHLVDKSDFDKRIAFISIDNAVELIIKTYLGLPKRIRLNSGPSRRELQNAENSFPTYLDLLEQYDSKKLTGISLEDIEWYHRLRNQLYHSGNGITVELAKVETYFEIAKALYQSLFEEEIIIQYNLEPSTDLGLFMEKWIKFESKMRSNLPPKNNEYAYYWKREYLEKIDPKLVSVFNELSEFRNGVIHGIINPTHEEFVEMIKNIDFIDKKISP